MKVGTDGVLLGAWTKTDDISSILDIGSGSGIISLMLAQKCDAKVIAIEIDLAAYQQSKENINLSEWADTINVLSTSLQGFVKESTKKFDLIVSNPPFFDITKEESSRAIARSELKLSLTELLQGVSKLLSPKGTFSVVFPFRRYEELTKLAENYHLFPKEVCFVKGNENASVKRALIQFSFEERPLIENSLTIEKKLRHDYTGEYRELLKDYLTIF